VATLQQVVQLVFEGVDNASNAAKGVLKGVEDVANAGKNLTQPLADATAGVLKFEAGLLLAGAALATVAANEAQKFEIAFREIATIIPVPIEELQGFRREILDYASSSTQALDQIIAATYDSISAGVDYTKALDRVREAEVLAVAGKATLGESSKLLNRVLEVFGETNYSAADAADALFTTVKEGVITIPELSAVLGRVAAIGGETGVSLEELLAAISALSKTQDPAAAVTGLLNVITGIIKPSQQAAAAAAALGLDFSVAGLEANGLQGMLKLILEKTGGSSVEIEKLFGNVRGLAGAFGLAREDGAAFEKALEAQKNKSGAAAEAFAKFKDVMDTGVDSVRLLAIELGTPLLQAFVNSKAEITNLTNALTDALKPGGPLSGISALLGKFGEDIEATLRDVAKNLPAALNNVDFSGFLKALESLWSAIGRLLRLDDLRTEEGLTAVIQTIVNLLTQTTTFTENALKAIEPLVKQIGEFAVAFSKIDPKQIALIGELGGYALAANIGFTALAAGAGTLYAAIKVVPPILLALKVEIAALGAFAAGASGAALLAFMGKAGIAGAAALLAYELGRDGGAIDQLKDFAGLDRDTNLAAGAITEGTNKIFGALLKLTGHLDKDGKPAMDRYADSAGGVGDALSDAGGDAASAAVELGRLENIRLPTFEYADELGGLATDAESAGQALSGLPGDIQKTNLAVIEAGKSTDEYAASLGGISTEYKQIGEGTVRATGAFAEVKTSTKDAAQALDELTQSGKLSVDELLKITGAANDFQIKMEEIASNERIKTIEAVISLDVARLEAETKQVEAAFDSVTATIESTGQVLGELYGLWTGAESSWDKAKIESWIREENRRRDAAMDMQNALIQAQIDSMKARTDAMNRGDAMITVNGDGLAPHLEAFMWEVLRSIQVQASQDMQEFLLNIGTGGQPA
jgi:TP901 family phage tail tape measure protein